MIITLFQHSQDRIPVEKELTWKELGEMLKTFRAGAKDGPLWSPVTYTSGATRGNAGIEFVNLAVFDIDGIKSEELEDLKARLCQVNYYLHSTYSDSPEERCFRLVLNMPEGPVKPLQWRRTTRDSLIARFEIPADPATKDPARIYYLPSSPDGRGEFFEGKADANFLDWQIKLFAINKKASTWLARRIALGQPLATSNRDDAMQKAAGLMAFNFPEASDEQIVEWITPAIKAMPSDHPLDFELDKFREKLDRARIRKQETDKEQAIFLGIEPQSVLQEKYTPAEMAQVPPKQWIIQKGDAFYLWENGTYTRPMMRTELDIALRQFLAKSSIQFVTADSKGKLRAVTTREILERHGTVADKLVGSLTASKSVYDEKARTFIEALAPMRPFEAIYHQDIQTWLEALGGDRSDKLLDWVACVTCLDNQCGALLLEGDSGAGKGLLATGLSALWSKGGPTPFDSITGDWNSLITSCPLVFADEGLPPTRKGSINDLLRQTLGSSSFSLHRKFLSDTVVQGSIRLILASNNERILRGFDEIGPEDRVALSQRIVFVGVNDGKARALLEGFPLAVKDSWAKQHIAEHALWLKANRVVKPGKRFLVEGDGNEIPDRLSVTAGLASDLIEFIINEIVELSKKRGGPNADHLIFGGGNLLVSSTLFRNKFRWETVMSTHTPSLQKVTLALRNISEPVKVIKGRAFYPIRLSLLETWQRIQHSDLWEQAKAEINK